MNKVADSKALLSILCDALDEHSAAVKAIDEWPFERPVPSSMFSAKVCAESRVVAARKACEWTVNNFRASARSEKANSVERN